MAEARGFAPARTALAGNPSDGYGGAVLAVTLDELGAEATASAAGSPRVTPPSTLVEATAARFARTFATPAATLEWKTSIPEGVGLGGSSAIVIACARALCELHGLSLDRDELAAFALAVEREDLGIAGGRQDQVAQSYGGLTLMDFARGEHTELDAALLPPLVVAWREECGEPSGIVHGDLRQRWAAGEASVRAALAELAAHARDAANALRAGDHAGFAHAVDHTYDLRARVLTLDPRHVAMIETARACGAAANYSGSGGAIVAVCGSDSHCETVLATLRRGGCCGLGGRQDQASRGGG